MNDEITISGNIIYRPGVKEKDGEYIIRNCTGQGWGLPTKDITPDDLRAVADHLEMIRKSKS